MGKIKEWVKNNKEKIDKIKKDKTENPSQIKGGLKKIIQSTDQEIDQYENKLVTMVGENKAKVVMSRMTADLDIMLKKEEIRNHIENETKKAKEKKETPEDTQ